jgi:FtsH-binding integral membrane protein
MSDYECIMAAAAITVIIFLGMIGKDVQKIKEYLKNKN